MKKAIIILIFLASTFVSYSQEVNKTAIDSVSQKVMLIGKCTLEGLMNNEVFNEAFKTENKYYKIDTIVAEQLRTKLDNISIVLFMGTWCGDSKEQVPRFFMIMDMLNFDTHSIKIYCNKRGIYADDPYANQFNIIKIPSFIIFKDGVEIGRIVETPKVSLEKDLLEIISPH